MMAPIGPTDRDIGWLWINIAVWAAEGGKLTFLREEQVYRCDVTFVMSRSALNAHGGLGRNATIWKKRSIRGRCTYIDYTPVRRIITATSALRNFPITASSFPASGDAIASSFSSSSILEEECRAQSLLLLAFAFVVSRRATAMWNERGRTEKPGSRAAW